MTAPVVVFLGPTLSNDEARDVLDAEYRPPAAHGDVFRAALRRPRAIGLVDGVFERVPAVWHKEVLFALSEGVRVYGAASMGALRAAELDAFGMRGVGDVYRAYADGVLEDDDEVAVLHGPAELGYPAVTEAMVNIRATLAAAVDAGVIATESAGRLTATAKALFYKDRTWAAIRSRAHRAGLEAAPLHALQQWLPAGAIDRKRRDAIALLDAVRAHLAAGVTSLTVQFQFAETAAWRAAREP